MATGIQWKEVSEMDVMLLEEISWTEQDKDGAGVALWSRGRRETVKSCKSEKRERERDQEERESESENAKE
jgi:hypothetical protein